MLNAAIKILTAALCSVVIACGTQNNGHDEARQLLDRAKAECEAGNITLSTELLDSLDKTYPGLIDIRRESLHVRAMIKERETVSQLEMTDSLAAVLSVRVDSLKNCLEWIANPIEGYYISTGSSLPPTGIEARVAPDGVFYIVSSLSGHNIGHTSITLSSSGWEAASGTVSRDGERNRVENGTEYVHFVGEEADTIGAFAADHAGQPLTLTFNGTSGYSRPLTMGEQQHLITVYEYASGLRRLKVAALEHERLEKLLTTARSQVARTMPDSVPDTK